jgi:hypothetical protein
MTCDETRLLLSALIDDALPAGERAACEAHLAACPDCPRELARLRATVGLVRGIAPARAPLGFADRVVATARAESRTPRSAGTRRRRAWPVGVPLGAAAAVLVALIGVSLYRLTPEQGQVVRQDAAPGTAPRASAPTAPLPPATEPPPVQSNQSETTPAPRPSSPPAAPQSSRDVASAPRSDSDTTRSRAKTAAPAVAAPGPSEPRLSDLGAARDQRARGDAAAPSEQAARAEKEAAPSAPAPGVPVPAREGVVPQALHRSLAGGPRVAEARLVVPSLESGERAVADVVSRLGARLEQRTEDADGVHLAIDVPAGAYAELARALAGIGTFSGPGEPATATEPTHVLLRLTR